MLGLLIGKLLHVNGKKEIINKVTTKFNVTHNENIYRSEQVIQAFMSSRSAVV